jgi:hypothetical protein
MARNFNVDDVSNSAAEGDSRASFDSISEYLALGTTSLNTGQVTLRERIEAESNMGAYLFSNNGIATWSAWEPFTAEKMVVRSIRRKWTPTGLCAV